MVKFRAVETAINASGVSATSVTVTKPTGTADGDLLIAITHSPASSSITAPAGWTRLGTFDDPSQIRSAIYKKFASSEGASYAWTFGTAGAIGVSIAAFSGAHDVLSWSGKVTGTEDPATGDDLAAARDAVGYQVYCWRNDTMVATVLWSDGEEKFDVGATSAAAAIRGQSGIYYGQPDIDDVINAGDTFTAIAAEPVQAPTGGIFWNVLLGDKPPENEGWDSTNGRFDVEVRMDRTAIDTTGDITTPFAADVTGSVVTISSSNDATEPDTNAADGQELTYWGAATATAWIQYDFGSTVNAQTVKRYRITSANSSERDPMNWTLQGSNDGSSFTTIDTRTNEAFSDRQETREFKVTSPDLYRYYRLDVSANYSSGSTAAVRVAELRLSVSDVWENITDYVAEEDKIRIVRGLQTTSGRADYTRGYFTLNNTDGRFSLRNQAGPFYGAIQRNSECRISKAYGTKSLQLQGAVQVAGGSVVGDAVRTGITAGLSITGDIDVRIDLDLKSWRGEQMLAGVATADGELSWLFWIDDQGKLNVSWKPLGGVELTAQSSSAVDIATRQAVRFTLDVDNGASGNTVTFYTADTISDSFTQLGTAETQSGTTSIGYPGGALCVGHVSSSALRGLHGRVYHFELRSGIAGTLTVDIDFTALTNGVRSFTSDSRLWAAVNYAVVSNRRYRMHGEIASWPTVWDTTGNWITAPITVAGIQKRLERGSGLDSVMFRHHTKGIIENPGFDFQRNVAMAYWPMEDEENSFRIASGLPGRPHMEILGTVEFAEFAEFVESKPILKLSNAEVGGAVIGGTSGFAHFEFLLGTPDGIPVGAVIATLATTGTVIKRWDIVYEATSTWGIRAYSEDALETGTPTFTESGISLTTAGERMHVIVTMEDLGATTDFRIQAIGAAGDSLGDDTRNFAVTTMGRVAHVSFNKGDVRMDDVYLGHAAVYGRDFPASDGPVAAWQYETAADRINRICDEEGIEFRLVGAAADSTFMGYQDAESPEAVMSTSANSDVGYLVDPLDAFGVEYRTGRSILNQEARITLDYDAGDLSGELVPVNDDSYIVNDATASRGAAGSSRFQLQEGSLSILQPPLGVGPYSTSESYSLAHEGQCVDLASWTVHQGTLDEEYYRKIQLALENIRIEASSTKTEAILDMDIATRVDITDTPDFLPADDIRQLVIGYEEWFDNFQHDFSLNTIPERAFQTAQYDHGLFRFDTAGSELVADITDSQTDFLVNTTLGQPWSTTADDFSIVINGERMLVTSIVDDVTGDKSDTFNRADSATDLGSTDGGVVEAWTQDLGTWGIQTNLAYISVAGNSIATLSGASDLVEVSVGVASWASGEAWVNFRFTDTSNRLRFGGTVGSPARFESIVGGAVVRTDIADTDRFTLASGQRLGVRCTGSVIEMMIDDILALTVSETDNLTGTRVGIQTATTVPRFNNWTYDLAFLPQTFNVTRGTNGVSFPHKSLSKVKLYRPPYRGL